MLPVCDLRLYPLSREGERPRLETEYETRRQAVLTLAKRHYTKARKRRLIHNESRHNESDLNTGVEGDLTNDVVNKMVIRQ